MDKHSILFDSKCSNATLSNIITLHMWHLASYVMFITSLKAIKMMKEIQWIQSLLTQNNSDLARIRTWNPLIRSQMPYPLGHGAFLKDDGQSIGKNVNYAQK